MARISAEKTAYNGYYEPYQILPPKKRRKRSPIPVEEEGKGIVLFPIRM